MSPEVLPFDSPSGPPSLSLRHIATALLLMVTLPVFALGALVTLPLILVAGAVETLRKLLMIEPRPRDTALF